MLDTVNAALKPKEGSPTSQAPDQADAEPDPASDDTDGEDTKDELSEKELDALSDRVKRRFGRLTSTIKGKDTEIGTLRPKADKLDQIMRGIAAAGLDGQDVDQMIRLGSMLKNGDPAKALEALRPVMAALERATGFELSPELKEQVRLGYLTEDHAIALSRAQAAATHATNRAAETQRQSEQAAQDRALETLVSTSIAAAQKWEKAKAGKDPDWSLKQDEVAEQVQLAIQAEALKRGSLYFPDAQEIVKLSEEALKKVNKRYSRFKPANKEILPQTSGASPRSKVAPKNTLDIINNVLAGR
jgi:hypothetical protein